MKFTRMTGKTCYWAGQSAKPIKEESAVSLVGAKILRATKYHKAYAKTHDIVAILVHAVNSHVLSALCKSFQTQLNANIVKGPSRLTKVQLYRQLFLI